MKTHYKFTAVLLCAVFSLLALGDDYRVEGYGNTPVPVYSTTVTHGSNTVQLPGVQIITGAASGKQSGASIARESGHIIKASAGALLSIVGTSMNTSGQWLMVFDSATVPGNNAVPKLVFGLKPYSSADPSTANFSFADPSGLIFTTGISWAISSTSDTLTIGTTDTMATWGFN